MGKGSDVGDEIGAELEKIRSVNPDGMLVPAEVVEAARPKGSPLHSKFTWDDKKAGQAWREQEARNLIRAHVTYEPQVERVTRAYVSMPTDRINGEGYRKTSEVIRNPNLVEQLIEEIRGKLNSMRVVYSHIKVLDPLWLQIERDVAEFMLRRSSEAAA